GYLCNLLNCPAKCSRHRTDWDSQRHRLYGDGGRDADWRIHSPATDTDYQLIWADFGAARTESALDDYWQIHAFCARHDTSELGRRNYCQQRLCLLTADLTVQVAIDPAAAVG